MTQRVLLIEQLQTEPELLISGLLGVLRAEEQDSLIGKRSIHMPYNAHRPVSVNCICTA